MSWHGLKGAKAAPGVVSMYCKEKLPTTAPHTPTATKATTKKTTAASTNPCDKDRSFANNLTMPLGSAAEMHIHYVVECEKELITFNMTCTDAAGGWMAMGFNNDPQVCICFAV